MAGVQNEILGLIGRKGSGKSVALRRELERCPRVFLFDTMGEHGWVPNCFYNLGEVEEFLDWARKQETFAGRFIAEENLEVQFGEVADLVYDHGNMTFALEELPMFCAASYQPPALDRIIRLGRHRRVNVFWTAQRMAEVSRRATAATDKFVLFSHTEPRDLDAIADRCGREVAEKVARLPLHGRLTWDAIPRGGLARIPALR